MICGCATISILFYNRITLWKQISNWRFGLTGWSECDLDFIFFFNSLSRTNISHNTKMNESEINAPRTFVMWTLWYSAPTCLTFWSAPICYSMHSLCWPRCQRSVSQEAIYFSCPDLPSPLSMLLLQNKLRISVKSFIDNVCFTIPLGFGFGIVCLKCILL